MTRTQTSESQDVAAVAKRIGLTIPPSATAEYVRYQSGMDDNARLILRMPSADWAAMQARPPLDAVPPDRYNANRAMRLGTTEGAWAPADERTILGAQLRLPNAEALNIGYAPAEGGQVRVYIFWHQT